AWGKRGDTLKLLNGSTVELDETVGVISDDRQVESLAGIMGGDSTAVTLDTTNIYLEAAFWWPDSIRGRARKYNFSTDAAHRFERGVDYATTVEHVERITQLILEICGGKAGPVDDQAVNLPQPAPVKMRVSRANRIIRLPIGADEIASIIILLGLPLEPEDDPFLLPPPSCRLHITTEVNLTAARAPHSGSETSPSRPPLTTARIPADHPTH
ncbi:phenylalanine--tRNA ligase subunit beta, partial [Burkholderia contaminans]